jgi:hypothetical protein
MYYGGISNRGVRKILGINKFNVVNWIKKASRTKVKRTHNRYEDCGIGRVLLVAEVQILHKTPGKYLHYDHGEPKATADRVTCGKRAQSIQDNSKDC